MSTATNPFETVRTGPDNVFFGGNGVSFNSEIGGVPCTTGFINPGTYEIVPETDEYILIHDGEVGVWTGGELGGMPEDGYGGRYYSPMTPSLILRGGMRHLLEIRSKKELMWNELITPTETFTYTCFYPQSESDAEAIKEFTKAQEYAVSSYLCELRGETPPSFEEWLAFERLPYDIKYGLDV